MLIFFGKNLSNFVSTDLMLHNMYCHKKNRHYRESHYESKHGGFPPEYMGREKFICDVCPSIFMDSQRLKSHKYHVHGPKKKSKVQQCPICDKKFTFLRFHIINKHSKDGENTHKFQCDTCSQRFQSNGKLKTHVKLVHERVKCDVCQQEICNYFMLKRHKAKVHGIIPSNVHKCEHCPLFFSTKVAIDKHMAKKHPSN